MKLVVGDFCPQLRMAAFVYFKKLFKNGQKRIVLTMKKVI